MDDLQPMLSGFRLALDALDAEPSALTAAHRFEELVFALLDSVAQRAGRRGIERYNRSSRAPFTAFLPEGLADLPGPTAIEVLFLRSNEDHDREQVASLAQRVQSDGRRAEIDHVLIVHNQTFGDTVVEGGVTSDVSDVDLVVWGAPELDALADREPAAWGALSEQFLFSSVERSLRTAGAWREQAASLVEELADRYANEIVTLVLGAGVSQDSGLPGWEALIGGLFTLAFGERLGGPIDREESLVLSQAAGELNSHSPLQTARYLRAMISSDAEFENKLASVLYAKAKSQPNPLLDSIALLCIPERDRSHVRSIITYNFDDLLERALQRLGIKTISIFRDHESAAQNELPIYHVHGYLPRDRDGFQHLDQSLLAFSEEAYHQLYTDPYHWTNIVQLNSLRENTCIFVGLSLADPNLRRLLDIGARGITSPRHYAMMRRVQEISLTAAHPALSTVSPPARRRFLDIHHALQESILRSLGVKVIWFDKFDEMTAALRSLRGV